MENFNFGKTLLRNWLIIVVITLVAFGASWFSYKNNKSESFSGSLSVNVHETTTYPAGTQVIVQSASGTDLQTAVATAQAWLKDPVYVSQILNSANVGGPKGGLNGYTQAFVVTAAEPGAATFQVAYAGGNSNEVAKVLSSVQDHLLALQDQFNQNSGGSMKMQLDFPAPLVVESTTESFPVTPIAGLVVGFIFAVIVVAIIDRRQS